MSLALAPGTALAGFFSGLTIDGPSPDIVGGGNVSVARDGTGGIAYLKRVGGVVHAFASTLTPGGGWGAPQQLDAGMAGPATQAAVAAAGNGRIAAAFVEGGELFAAVQDSGQSSFSQPQPLAGGALNPSLDMSANGTGYVSFTASGPAGAQADVYLARLDRSSTTFAPFGAPLNLDPARRAGYGDTTRSMVAVGTDGQALVTWAEDGSDGHTHVIARRASDAGVSPVAQDLTLPSLQGQPGGSADMPFAALRDASDFGWVAFRESFTSGGAPQSRTIARFQRGSSFDDPNLVDPLTFPSADGATGPQVGIDGTGSGLTVAGLTGSHQVYADPILDPDSVMDPELGTPARMDSAPSNVIAPQPVVAIGGIDNIGALAWLQSTGPADPASVHVRPFANSGFAPEGVGSNPALGPVDTGATGGTFTGAADRYGDAFFAFAQGPAGARRIVLGGIANPPGDFDLRHADATNRTRPVLTWSAAKDILGLSGYEVRIDGAVVATVQGRSYAVVKPLAQGPHRVAVVAVDRYGQRTSSPGHVLRVDTRAPHPRLSVSGSRSAGSRLRFSVHAGDGPHSSGVGSVSIAFGDGAASTGATVTHAYSHSGTFTVRVVVRDRAGNSGRFSERIRIG